MLRAVEACTSDACHGGYYMKEMEQTFIYLPLPFQTLFFLPHLCFGVEWVGDGVECVVSVAGSG